MQLLQMAQRYFAISAAIPSLSISLVLTNSIVCESSVVFPFFQNIRKCLLVFIYNVACMHISGANTYGLRVH